MSMVRISKLEIVGFRGARFPLLLELTGDCRSIAIFGENGAGKSTVTDAVEWFLNNRVDHLWKEDCKEESLRNVRLNDSDESYVSVDFSDKGLSGQRILKPNFKTASSNTSIEFKNYIVEAASEQHFLRHEDLTRFINEPKGNKRKEIASIIGFDDIQNFRNAIQQTLNALQKEPEYLAARKNVETSQARLLEASGSVISSKAHLYQKANELIAPFALELAISDDPSYESCITELKKKIRQQEKLEKKLGLERFKSGCDDLAAAIKRSLDTQESFLTEYKRLVANKEGIKQLNIEDFLHRGLDVLSTGVTGDELCPFCGSRIDLAHLKSEVERRIQDLAENRREFEACRNSKDTFVSSLRQAIRLCDSLKERGADAEIAAVFLQSVAEYAENTTSFLEAVNEGFDSYEAIVPPDSQLELGTRLLEEMPAQALKAEDAAKLMELSKEEEIIIDVINNLDRMRGLFAEYEENIRTQRNYERQINTLDFVFKEFVKVQNVALQDALDVMSADIGRFYNYLHPEENVESVRLRIVGDEGVEFEYSFHGRKTYPPLKYLSESHLNSLGIALFLSSVKLFNKRSNYFVLDDVVTSFDAGHRRRLIRLLHEKFKDWQVILLTHENFWFDIIRRELGPEGWLIKEVEWDGENGVIVKPSPKDWKELIAQKKGKSSVVANDVRSLIERLLKEVCESLEVKVAFRSNDFNERRMPGELLSGLRGTINRKCAPLKGHPSFSKLEGSIFVGTTGSHARPESLSSGDINLALQDLDEFANLFSCQDCGTMVAIERFRVGDGTITCKCGNKSLEWKK